MSMQPYLRPALLALCLVLIWKEWHSIVNKVRRRRSTLRSLGLPNPEPFEKFDLETATTRNHVYVNKVLRYPYFQTMAHQPMNINDWIEIDKDYTWYLEQKAKVIQEQGKHVLDSLPENDEACTELLEVLVDWLPRRYPTLFEEIKCAGSGIWNKVTNEKFKNVSEARGTDALRIISRLVQDDFLMAKERLDGQVYFTGGLVAFPGFYLLSKKINRTLKSVHSPVPQFNEKLLVSVERTLKRFKPNEPFERTSWEIVDDRNLFYHNIAATENVNEAIHPKDLWFRVDHQTFMKLPRSNGIIFGVHPIMKRLADFEDSPLVPALLTTIHSESDKRLLDYKLAPAYQERMIPYLQKMTERQIAKGLIKGDEEVSEFRELIVQSKLRNGDGKGEGEDEVREPPSTQSSLRFPTESEIAFMGA